MVKTILIPINATKHKRTIITSTTPGIFYANRYPASAILVQFVFISIRTYLGTDNYRDGAIDILHQTDFPYKRDIDTVLSLSIIHARGYLFNFQL